MDGYGYYPRTAVAGDLLQALSNLQSKRNMSIEVKDVVAQRDPATNGNLPPIVLVHGIFGFGKGRLGGLSYFAGAEKKDERVLVPDLGSLTSIYDRFVLWSLKHINSHLQGGGLWTYWGMKKNNYIKLREKYFKENGGMLLQRRLASRQGGLMETTKIFTAEELEKATDN
ncbi:hypothetical protein ACFX1S_036594 [Malus domestica]